MPTGKCPHGEFDLEKGCPKCMEAARIAEAVEGTRITVINEEGKSEKSFIPFDGSAAFLVNPGDDFTILKLYEESKAMLAYAKARVIPDVAALGEATKDLALITSYRKALEEKRKEYVNPIREKLDAFNAAFKEFMEPVTEAEAITKRLMLQFHAEQKRVREEAERIEAEKLQLAQEEMDLKGEHTQELGTVEIPAAVGKATRTEVGTAGTFDVWKYEVVDIDQVPRWCMIVDHAQLQAIAKKHHDQKPVAGIRFYNEPSLRMNTR